MKNFTKVLVGTFLAVMLVTSTSSAAMTWSRSLKLGVRGADVKDLQMFLNMCADTKVANSGAGSPGMETTYFGPATKAAVIKFQAARGVSPQSGLFGPLSRAKAAELQASSNVCGGGVVVTPPNQTGPVMASLATNNPASGTLVAGQATADLAHFTFSGTGTVTAVTLQRIGVSADTTPSNVYLFDGATRLTDAASVSSNGTVTFSMPSGIFMVNGLKTISVKSDIAGSTSGQTVGFKLATFTTPAGVVTANLSGNIHSIASATLATVAAGTVTPSGATLNPGSNVTLWQSTLTVSNRDVWMKRISLRNVGSAPANAFANFKLYVNGVQVGTSAGLDMNGYVTFDLSSAPVSIVSGSRVVRVDADIISGASRTVQLSLRNAADIDLVDSSFGVNVTASSTPWAAASASTISGASGGSLTIEKDVTSTSGNVSEGTNDKTIGVFKVTAFGEPMKIETLRATFTGSDASVDSLRNGRIMIGGVQYGSTSTLMEDSSTPAYTSYTLNYTVYPGTPVMMELRADMYDNDGTDDLSNGDTIVGTIAAGSSNVQKVDSLGTISAPNATTVAANTLTIADASATLTKNGTYANQTVVLPTTGFKVGSWNLAGSSTEDILLTTLSLDVDEVDTTGGVFNESDMTNMYVVVKNGATVVAQTSPVATVAAADNNFSINYTLAKNTNVSIELFANLADAGTAAVAPNSVKSDLTVTGTAMVSGSAVTATSADTDGQTIAVGTASITATADASTPAASIVYDNQTVTAAAFKFAAVTSAYDITDLTFTLADATVASSVDLYDGATLVASRPGAATVTFSGLAWNIPANTNKVLTAKLVLGSVGVGAGSTGASQLLTMTAFTAINKSSGVSAVGTGTPAGNAMYAYAAIPSIQQIAVPNTTMTAGTNTIAKFSVSSNGGSIAWKEVLLDINKSAAPTLSSVTLWDVTGGTSTQVTAATAFQNGTAGVATTCVADNTFCELMITVGTKADDNVEQQVSGTKTYEVRATIGGTLAADVYVSSTLTSNLGFVASNVFTTADNDTTVNDATFVWSDISAQSHDTGTADWSNEYKVVGIPTASSWTITY